MRRLGKWLLSDAFVLQSDAAWACLRAIVFLLKQVFVSLFETVDAAVIRRRRESDNAVEVDGRGGKGFELLGFCGLLSFRRFPLLGFFYRVYGLAS